MAPVAAQQQGPRKRRMHRTKKCKECSRLLSDEISRAYRVRKFRKNRAVAVAVAYKTAKKKHPLCRRCLSV